jgi:hypothetical protein
MTRKSLASPARRSRRALWLLPVGVILAGSCSDSTGTGDGGPPAEMIVLDGNEQEGTVGEELPEPLVVKVTDERGRAVRGQLVNWRVTHGGGSVFAGSSITDSRGEARERWTLGTVAGASQRVEVRAVDNQSGAALVFATFTATAKAGPVTSLTAVTTGTLVGTAGAALPTPIVVRATDQYGNSASGASVTWEATGGGSTSPATWTADGEGKASTPWTLGTASGSQQLTARSGTATPVTFAATARAGGVSRLEVVSGDGRDGTVGLPLDEPLVVRALDALGNAVAEVTVTWSVRSGGGTVSPTTSTTNESGVTQTTWTLGMAAGTQTVAASASGVQEVLFTATAKAVPTGSAQWSVLAAGGSVSLKTVWAASPTNIVAIGADNRTFYRFDGSEWRTESVGAPTGQDLESVWGSSASDIYVVGGSGPGWSGIVRFDGSSWQQVTGAQYYGRTMVWGRGPNDVYVATNGSTLSGNMWHFDGSSWRDVHVGPYDYTSRPWYCPQAVFVGGSADDVFAADACNGEYEADDSGWNWIRTDIRRMAMWGALGSGTYGVDGSGVWIRTGSGQSGSFSLLSGSPSGASLWGTSGSDLFVAGSGIHHFDGSSWTQALDGGPYLYVRGFGGSEIVAVGSNGRVVRGTR